MYDQHTPSMATTRHRSLVGRGGRKAFVRDKGLAHTQKRLLKNLALLARAQSLSTTAWQLSHIIAPSGSQHVETSSTRTTTTKKNHASPLTHCLASRTSTFQNPAIHIRTMRSALPLAPPWAAPAIAYMPHTNSTHPPELNMDGSQPPWKNLPQYLTQIIPNMPATLYLPQAQSLPPSQTASHQAVKQYTRGT